MIYDSGRGCRVSRTITFLLLTSLQCIYMKASKRNLWGQMTYWLSQIIWSLTHRISWDMWDQSYHLGSFDQHHCRAEDSCGTYVNVHPSFHDICPATYMMMSTPPFMISVPHYMLFVPSFYDVCPLIKICIALYTNVHPPFYMIFAPIYNIFVPPLI